MYAVGLIFGLACLTVAEGKIPVGYIFPERVITYRASHGQDAVLPCGPDKVFLDGPDSYVVWVKDDGEIIYKYPDVKNKRPLVLDHKFKRECHGPDCPDNTALLVEKIQEKDGGLYQCRVHFQASPAADYSIRVIVVGSPGQPKIYNELGLELVSVVGPLEIGANFTLICEVTGDHADTSVWWERNGVVVNASRVQPGILTPVIRMANITRDEFDAKYVCFSQNSDVTEPLFASVVIKMILLPLSVEIRLNNNVKFVANEPRVVDCVIVGCVPPPTVTWFLDEFPLKSGTHTEHHDGNFTVSSLTLTVQLTKKPQRLVCRAQNYLHAENLFESQVNLSVGYKPKCVSGGRIPKFGVVSGETETAACLVDSYPAPYHFVWYLDQSGPFYTVPIQITGKPTRYTSTFNWTHSKDTMPDSQILVCAAINEFGKQDVFCKFAVFKGGPPAPPKCELLAQHPKTLFVNCSKTWDGGRTSIMELELHNGEKRIVANYTDDIGYFRLGELKEANMTALVYSSNVRGRSKPLVMELPNLLHNFTDPPATPLTTHRFLVNWWQAMISAVIAMFGLLVIAQCSHIIANKFSQQGEPSRNNGVFHREPEFPMLTREERCLANITVNQGSTCPPVSYVRAQSPSGGACRVMIGCHGTAPTAPDCGTQSFYV